MSEAPETEDEPRPRERRHILDHVNTWMSAVGAIVSVSALIVAAMTLRDQQTINSHQVAIDSFQQQREQRVYASRVSMWVQIGEDTSSVRPRGLDVQIGDRSPVPIRSIVLYLPAVDAAGAVRTDSVVVGDIPPCKQVSFRVFARSPMSIERRDQEDSFGVSIVFHETVNTWTLTSQGLAHLPAPAPRPTAGPGTVGAIRDNEQDLSDCGEGA